MHALPRGLRKGGQADAGAALEPTAAGGALHGDAGCLDLRTGAGRAQPDPAGDAAFPRRGMTMTTSDTITFTLDGATATARPGQTIWEVANGRGLIIPHLCHKPAPGYRPDGNCRACMV